MKVADSRLRSFDKALSAVQLELLLPRALRDARLESERSHHDQYYSIA